MTISDEFVTDWINGKICFGSWHDHLNSWLNETAESTADARKDSRVLVISYEEMKESLGDVVLKIARHLRVELNQDQLRKILPKLSFDYMKSNIKKFEPRSVKWIKKNDGFSFVRKGEVGDAKNLFSQKHETQFLEYFRNSQIPKSCYSKIV